MNPFTTHGALSWAELLAADADAAVDFYQNLLGWGHEEMPMGEATVYHVMKAGPINAGGIMQRPMDEIPPFWSYYITVDDIDEIAAAATAAGAKLVVPVTEAPGVGRFCGFEDPQGAYLSAITYSGHSDDGSAVTDFKAVFGTHGLFSWIELRTSDVDLLIEFYRNLFGWTVTEETMPMGPYHVIKVGDVGIGGITRPPAPDMPPHWGGYVTVDDADTVEAAAEEGGATIAVSAFDVATVGRMVHLIDPQGAALAMIKYAEMEVGG